MFDRGAESNVKTIALKHYAKAETEFWTEGTVNPIDIYRGITDAHSYDNFGNNRVSNQAYHHQPTFEKQI